METYKIIIESGSSRKTFPGEQIRTQKNIDELDEVERKLYDLITGNKNIKSPTSSKLFRYMRDRDIIFTKLANSKDYLGIYAYNTFDEETRQFTTHFAYRYRCDCPCSDRDILRIEWDKKGNLDELNFDDGGNAYTGSRDVVTNDFEYEEILGAVDMDYTYEEDLPSDEDEEDEDFGI